MIYAIILIIFGLISLLFNQYPIIKKTALRFACIAPLIIIWGVAGIVILSTIRYSVIQDNAVYWFFLICGSVIEILIGLLFIYRYLKIRKYADSDKKFFQYQNILGVIAILVGITTIIIVI